MKNLKWVLGSLLIVSASFSQAAIIEIEHKIYSVDNLYYTDWGHWWAQAGDGDVLVPNNNDGALGDGQAARYLSLNGSAFGFSRSQIQSLTISVTGSVVDNGAYATSATGNDCYINLGCNFNDGYFHGLPAYSVIGLWSTTSDTITPVKYDDFGNAYAAGDAGYDDLPATTSSPFFIGNGGVLNFAAFIPDSVETLYLFLGENDGIFSDNNPNEFYSALIRIETPEVPVPASAWLMGSALIGLSAVARRRRIA